MFPPFAFVLVPLQLYTLVKAGEFRREIRGTSLQPGYWWGVGTLVFGLILTLSFQLIPETSELVQRGARDRLHYLLAVLLICPLIAILGARRPGAAVWIWFVVVPLIAVLCIPPLHPRQGKLSDPLLLAPPALIGVALAIVMGFGNYLGTRFSLPALLSPMAIGLLLAPSTDLGRRFELSVDYAFAVGMTLVNLAVLLALKVWRNRSRPADPLLACWQDMKDLFGVAWSRRWMDRINAIATSENWPFRLKDDHLEWCVQNLTESEQAAARAELEKRLRWMLKRFADDAWIEGLFRKP